MILSWCKTELFLASFLLPKIIKSYLLSLPVFGLCLF